MSLPRALFWQWCAQGREAMVSFSLARMWLCWNGNAILCYGAPCPPFIGASCSYLALALGQGCHVAQKVERGASQPGCPWTRSMSVKLTPVAE